MDFAVRGARPAAFQGFGQAPCAAAVDLLPAAGTAVLMLWLWAQAVAHFEQRHIAFEACFPALERRWLAPSSHIFRLCVIFTWLVFGGLALCTCLCAATAAAVPAAAGSPAGQPPLAPLLVPPLLYLSLALALLLPVNVLRKSSRMFFACTLLKVLVPLQPVGWADFLLADMLTSLAKSSSDITRSACLMLHGPLAHPFHPYSATAASACGYLSPGSLAALVLPFLVRMLQCISVWRAGGPRSQLFNALKYASSLPALILTAHEHEHHVQE
ncbi:EXS family-domain-containing protein [Scenedesmus sp. NREL 46B-D3]|nr:EXS family-domain-containing protein [Scenedesmus sp. NREL 46B-D3]